MPHSLEVRRFDPVVDDRGSLLPIEFAQVPFTVRRSFVVTGPAGGATRGNHLVACYQLLCLLSGRSEVRIGADAGTLGDPAVLEHPGDYVVIEAGDFVSYTLDAPSSTVMVLAEQPFEPREG